ncbi:hypothetical protein [Aeromonas phage Aes516]|nr:hypothetical protein [Aeromonas phage Aes516]
MFLTGMVLERSISIIQLAEEQFSLKFSEITVILTSTT